MVSGLDMLKALNDILTEKEKSQFCDWIYSQQIEPRPGKATIEEGYKIVNMDVH